MKLLTKFALPVVAMAGICAPACATAFSITLSGTIASGADDLGVFGAPFSPLIGEIFTIRYTIDPVSMTTTTEPDGVTPLYRFDNPGQMTIDITIKGRTFHFAGTAQGTYTKADYAAAGGNPAYSKLSFNAYDGTNSLTESVTADNAPLGGLAPIPPGALGNSTLNLSLFQGAVRASSVTSGTVAIGAVPEPASWALMIVGFGAVGMGLRRHRTRVAFAG